MNTMKEYKSELLIASMMLLQVITIFFPALFPAGFGELVLLSLLIVFILSRIHMADLALKRKYN